jgi:glycosyltransferase involved in cell wall biosynthesis
VGAAASRFVYRPILSALARWDASTASRVTRFVANSAYVAGRIRRYYDRAATVVHPPVDTGFFTPGPPAAGDHFLIVSALVPYKRIELAIDACALAGVPLQIAGDGPDRERLETRAAGKAIFLGPLSGDALRREYRRARAVLLPGEEDFGIVPVEAQGCGTPVVALGRGGALETVIDGSTGVLFDEATAPAMAEALRRVSGIRFDAHALHRQAGRFSRDTHAERMRAVIGETLAAPRGTRW